MPRRFHDLAELQREDAEAAEHGYRRPHGFWARLRAWSKRLGHVSEWLKNAGAIVAGTAALVTGTVRLYQMFRARSVAPAQEPATGVASTALDRVDPPKPPAQLSKP